MFDTSKMQRELGLEPRSLPERIHDSLEFFKIVPQSAATEDADNCVV